MLKKIIYVFLIAIIVTSCSKSNSSTSSSNGNNGPSSNSNFHDSSLLFGLNVVSNGFNDTSVYKNQISLKAFDRYNNIITTNIYSVLIQNNTTWLKYNTIEGPNSFNITFPNNQINNSTTMFLDFKNDTINYPTSDTSSYSFTIGLGLTDWTYDTFIFSGQYSSYPGYNSNYFELVSWKSSFDNCIDQNWSLKPISTGGSSPYVSFTKPLKISPNNGAKLICVITNNNLFIYYNGSLFYQNPIGYYINLNQCSDHNNFYFITNRGTLLRNLKVWNRALTQTEINNL